jgi:hypothetical protein
MLFAKFAKFDPTDPSALNAWVKQSRETEPTIELLQSHYTVDGSYEEKLKEARHAFSRWCKTKPGSDYYWSDILAVFDDHLIVYKYDYDASCEKYFTVAITWSGEECTVSGEPGEVGVTVVVKALEGSDDTKEQAMTEKQKAEEANKQNLEQEGQESKSGLTATSGGPEFAGEGNTPPTNLKTEAETAGAGVPEPNADAVSATGVEHAGDEGATPAPDASKPDEIKPALADTEEGLKQAEKPVEIVNNPDFLVQGVAVAKDGSTFTFLQSAKPEGDGDGKKLHIQGIATRADILNTEGQVYPLSAWEANMDRMNELAQAGKFLGKLEHPQKEQGLVDAAIKFNKFWMQGSDVMFDATVIPTEPHGKNLQAMLEAGVQIDMSSRGYGTLKQEKWRGMDAKVIQDDFVCVGFDAVLHGASVGSGVTEAYYQSKSNPTPPTEETTEMSKEVTQSAADRATLLQNATAFKQTKANLLAGSGLNTLGQAAYVKALDAVEDGNLDALFQTSDTILPVLTASFAVEAPAEAVTQSATHAPKFYVAQSQEETAPQTVGEMFDRMVADLPDGDSIFRSPRKQVKQAMVNMANSIHEGFNGRAAALGLLALEQGKIEQAGDILTQSLQTGATVSNANEAGNGAPLSAPMIFPLVRRVYPKYIMNEIASIQPMDRPEGKIFYLDTYRTEDPDGEEKRMDLNTSANPFNSSYADNATEGAAAELIRLRLSSVTVTAYTKKLGAAWSLEEMQDLRAYHGLDASQELMNGTAREMALEWNKTVLDDMLQQATAAALTYGKTKPASGFDAQVDWDAYLWVYIQHLDNTIFSKRNGPMTHLVVGLDAALALAKSGRMTFGIGGENGGDMDEMFPGTTYFGVVNAPNGSKYKVFKTNFWGVGTTNGSKILGLRKGSEWSDTPYVWCPYADYVTPLLTDPADFTQKQGIMSRAAKKVVVPDAMGYITVDTSTGVVL